MIEFLHSDRLNLLREFMLTRKYILILFLIAAVLSGLGLNVFCVLLFACIIGATLVLSNDLMATFAPFMLLCLVAAKCYDSYSIFIKYIPLGIILGICYFLHFYAYRKPMEHAGMLTYPMIFVSVAVILGGVGFISAKEYFAPVSIFYMGTLGFGMLFVYWMLRTRLTVRKEYSISDKITEVMVISGCFASLMLIIYYLVNINEVIANHEILYMQWRNNYSTFLMLAIPFAFYYGHKKPYSIMLGFFFYFAILLTGSRGGLVFGAIDLLMCCVLFTLFDKRRRLTYIVICALLLFAVLVFSREFFTFIGATLDRLFSAINGVLIGEQQEQRYFQYVRGIQDFVNNPILGTGIGYMGNRDIYPNVEFSVCWYHCSPIQIASSFGVVGIAAYLTQFVARIVLLCKKPTMFNMTVFLSYISLELMSLVNPGIFVPVPYLLIVTLFFAVVENCNGDKTQSRLNLRWWKKDDSSNKRRDLENAIQNVEEHKKDEELVTK